MIKHFTNYFGSNIASKALSIISIPIITRILLPEDFGMISLFTTYSSIAAIILTANLYTSISRYFFEKDIDFKLFVSTSFLSSIIATFVLGILGLIILYSSKIDVTLPYWAFALMILQTLFAISTSVFLQIHEPAGKSAMVAKRTVISGVLQFLLTVVIVIFAPTPKWMYVVFGNVFSAFLTNIFFYRYIKEYLTFRLSFRYLTYIFGYSIPMIPYALSWIILSQIDRVMIGNTSGVGNTGLYSFAVSLAMLVPMIGDALNRAWTPSFFKYMNEGNFEQLDKECAQNIRYWVITAITFILLFLEPAYFFIGAGYHQSFNIIPIVIVGFLFEYYFTIYARNIGYSKKTIYSSLVLLSAGIINIVLNFYTLRLYGYKAAAINTLVSLFCLFVFSWGVSKYIIKVHTMAFKKLLPQFGLILVSSIVFYSDSLFPKVIFYVLFKYIALAVLLLLFYRDLIFSAARKIFKITQAVRK